MGSSDSSSLAYSILPGMRAITVEVDQFSGIAYLIQPGNHVDLIAELPAPEEKTEETSTTATPKTIIYSMLLMEDRLVLAVDSIMPGSGSKPLEDETQPYTAVTIQVTPEQAAQISLVQATGSLNLVLRSPLDDANRALPSCPIEPVLSR